MEFFFTLFNAVISNAFHDRCDIRIAISVYILEILIFTL